MDGCFYVCSGGHKSWSNHIDLVVSFSFEFHMPKICFPSKIYVLAWHSNPNIQCSAAGVSEAVSHFVSPKYSKRIVLCEGTQTCPRILGGAEFGMEECMESIGYRVLIIQSFNHSINSYQLPKLSENWRYCWLGLGGDSGEGKNKVETGSLGVEKLGSFWLSLVLAVTPRNKSHHLKLLHQYSGN